MTLNSTIFSVLCVNTRSVLAHNNTTKLNEIVAYVKNDISCVRRFDFELDNVEVLWLGLRTANLRCLHIAVCCLPPNFYSLFKQELTDAMPYLLF